MPKARRPGLRIDKDHGQMRQVMVCGPKKVDEMFVLNMAAYNLVRMRSLGQARLQSA